MGSKNKTTEQWAAKYDASKKEQARICAEFHSKWNSADKNRDTYKRIAKRVIDDPDVVLTRKQFNKLCCNKLSKKVLKENYRPPKFKAGEMIKIAMTTPFLRETKSYLAASTKCIVIEYVGQITKPMKGSKKYKILPIGKSTVLTIEERYLEGFRK